MTVASFAPVLPALVVAGSAIVALMVQVFSPATARVRLAVVALLGLSASAAAVLCQASGGSFGAVITADPMARLATVLIATVAAVSVAAAQDLVTRETDTAPEYFALLLFAVIGMFVMVSATELIALFLGFETMSIAVYVLAGVWRGQRGGNEAAIKYFLLGAFASAVMVYGIALVYAGSGTTELAGIAAALSGGAGPALLLGTALVMVGFAFKVAAVPFHLWTPDVYEGAPTPVTLFMATAVKAAAFLALLRVFWVALAPIWSDLTTILALVAALTMTAGNLAALRQTSTKRMLAYSAIAHTGYMLMGLAAVAAGGGAAGAEAVVFYLLAYAAMNAAAFAVLVAALPATPDGDRLEGLAGLGGRRPALALAMTVAMLSLTGFPPLAGFMGKFYLFAAALEAGLVWLVLLAVLNTVVSAAYYLGVLRAMYFAEAPTTGPLRESPATGSLLAVTVWAAALATVAFGVLASPLMGLAGAAVAGFVGGS